MKSWKDKQKSFINSSYSGVFYSIAALRNNFLFFYFCFAFLLLLLIATKNFDKKRANDAKI